MSAEPSIPDPHAVFIATAPALAALTQLEQRFGARAPFVLLTGRDGMGKRTLAREALRRLGKRVTAVHLPTPAPDVATMAGTLLVLFGGREQPGKSALAVLERLLEALANATSGGRVAVLVVSSAHALVAEQLLELKRIAVAAAQRQCPLEVWLVGLPTLEQQLAEDSLTAVREKVSVRCQPAPLSPTDTRHYVQLRPNSGGGPSTGQFSRKACRDIHAATGGVPGAIEAIAAEAARRASRLSASTVSPEHVRAAASAMRSGRIAGNEGALSPPPRREEKPLARPARPAPTFARPTPAPAPALAPITPPAMQVKPANAPPAVPPAPARITTTPATQTSPTTPTVAAKPSTAAIPPRPSTPAPAPATETSSVAASDPRVQDWVARFGGGSSVRVGASHVMPLTAEELMDDAQGTGSGSRGGSDDGTFWRANALTPPPPLPRPRGRPLGQRQPRVPWTAIAAVMAAGVLGVLYAQRGGLTLLPALPAVAASFRRAAPAERDTALLAAAEAVRALRAAKQAAAELAARERFAVAVGTYLNRDMARSEEEHLARLISYRVWVTYSNVEGVRTYRLLLGTFDSVEAAENAAQTLMRRGLLRDASVVPVPTDSTEH